jgi:RHS repeat-associated protein
MSAAVYDGTGMRTSAAFTPSAGSSVAEDYVWNGDRLLMDAGAAYIYAGHGQADVPIEQVSLATGTIAYLVTDRLGSVRGTLDSTGALTGTTSYDAWGNPQSTGGLIAVTPFGYAGGYTDPDGLIYLANRYYDPATGQLMSLDPEISMTRQAYAYANDNPVNAKDPNGLATLGACAGGGMDIGAGTLKA